MSPRATARVVVSLARRSIVQAFRRPGYLAPVLIFPSLFLAVNTGGAGQATELPAFPEVNGFLDFQLAGAMMQSAMLASVSGGISLALDLEMGFTDRLLAAPIPRWSFVVGRLAATGLLGLIGAVWFLVIGLILGVEIQGGVAGVALVLVLMPTIAFTFGGVGAALALKTGKVSVVSSVFPLVVVTLFFSSAFFPVGLLLEPAQTIADWNPISLIADGLREPIAYGLSLDQTLGALLGIAIIAVIGIGSCALALRSRLRAA